MNSPSAPQFLNLLTNAMKTFLTTALVAAISATAHAKDWPLPLLVPITGPAAIEGTAQRNGGQIAATRAIKGRTLRSDVTDTGGAADGGANAMSRHVESKDVLAVVGSTFGTQVLAMLPLAEEYKLPLITTAGTAPVTEQGNPYVFRFYPSDALAKLIQVRYAVEQRGLKRAAILFNTTAYGQSGQGFLKKYVAAAGGEVVYEEGLSVTATDFSSAIQKTLAAKPDVILLQTHGAPGAILLKQLAAAGVTVPVVGSTTLTNPGTLALLEPRDLKGFCAETASVAEKGKSAEFDRFIDDYQKRFNVAPDAFAIQQYDGSMMVAAAFASGVTSREAMRHYLATQAYPGIAMTYQSDGKGNMAHSAVVVCYDGTSTVPQVVNRYADIQVPK